MAKGKKVLRRQRERNRKKERREEESAMKKRGPRPLEFLVGMDETDILEPAGGFDSKYEAAMSIAEYQAKHSKVRVHIAPHPPTRDV